MHTRGAVRLSGPQRSRSIALGREHIRKHRLSQVLLNREAAIRTAIDPMDRRHD